VGIGLPSTIRGAEREQVLEWARRAEARDFSSLGTIDRIVYDNYEPLITLAAAAAVTERIRLATTIMIAPYRANGALVAKQAASVDRLSHGRLVLGVAVGGREDDYEASGIDFHQRGKLFDRQLDDLRRFWSGEKVGFAGAVGPQPWAGRPKVVIGGRADAVFRRAAQFDGWMMGGGQPDAFPPEIVKLNAAWAAAGREGEPRRMSLGYFGLGSDARDQVRRYITDYYGFLGSEAAEGFAAGVPTTPEAINEVLRAFEAAGCDEFILFPTSSDAAQVELLANAVL